MTAVQNKEKSAERELVEALEGIADELYPETATGSGKQEDEDEGEMDMEAMLKKELSGISSVEKSRRIRLCKHDTACCMFSLLPCSFMLVRAKYLSKANIQYSTSIYYRPLIPSKWLITY